LHPHAATVDSVPAIRFDGSDSLKAKFEVEKKIAGAQRMALEIWLRSENPSTGDGVLGWQSLDGKETSASIGTP
jgi:hypothetical protein